MSPMPRSRDRGIIFLVMVGYKGDIGVVDFDPETDKILGMWTLFFIEEGSLSLEVS